MKIYKNFINDYKNSVKNRDQILKYALRSILDKVRALEKKYSKSTPEDQLYSDSNLVEAITSDCLETIKMIENLLSVQPQNNKIKKSVDDLRTIFDVKIRYLPVDEIRIFENKYKDEILKMSPGWNPPSKPYISKPNKPGQPYTSNNKDNDNSESGSSVGSGFFVDKKGHVVTNYHVVKNCNNNSKVLFNHKQIDATLIAYDEVLDIALLDTQIKNKYFIKFSTKSPQKAQNILVAGFPYGKFVSDDLKITSGIINSLKGISNNTAMLQIDATINPGNSGGPIVDQQSGSLVGIATMKLSKDFTKQAFGQESENTNYGIKSSQVRDFLEANNIKITIKNNKFNINELEASTVFISC